MQSLRVPFSLKDKLRFWESPIFWQIPGPLILIGKLLLKGEVLYWGTVYLQFTPWRYSAWQMLQHGMLPLWNSLNGLGAPLLANYQTAFLYPPNLLVWVGAAVAGVKGIALAETALVLLHLVASGTGFVYLLRALGFKPLVQTIGGMAYALCGYQIARASFLSMNAALVWLPWLLFLSFRWIQALAGKEYGPVRKYAAWQILCTFSQLMAGHAQVTWYSQLLVLIWMVVWLAYYRQQLSVKMSVLVYAAILFFSVGLAMVQLLPTAEYLRESQRANQVSYDYAVNYSFWPWRVLSLFSPNLFGNPGNDGYWVTADNYWEDAVYIGLLPVLFALVALIQLLFNRGNLSSTHRRLGWFAMGTGIVGFVIALGWHTPVFPFLYQHIPTFNLFQAPTRFNLWLEMGLILLGCIGLEKWMVPEGRVLYWSRLGMMGAATAVMTVLLVRGSLAGRIHASYLNGSLESAVLLLIAAFLNLLQPENVTRNRHWQLSVVLFVLADLVYSGWYLNPGMPLRVLGETGTTGFKSDLTFLSPQQEEQIKYKRFFKFDQYASPDELEALPHFLIPNTNLYSQSASLTNFDPFVPARYPDFIQLVEDLPTKEQESFLSWLGVNCVQKDTDPGGCPVIKAGKVQESYVFVTKAISAESAESALQKTEELIHSGAYNDTAIVEGISQPIRMSNGSGTKLQKVVDQANHQVFQISAGQDGWLVQKVAYYPGWHVKIDGVEAKLFRADFYLRAVRVESGEHTVEFSYSSASFLVGAGISLASFILLVFVEIWNQRKQPHGNG